MLQLDAAMQILVVIANSKFCSAILKLS